jgi:energy-coupling factor transporter ATP-binding protein EcfA2
MSDQLLTDVELPADEIIDQETGWDVRMVRRMAKTIQLAHDSNPGSWALITGNWDRRLPFLNIGGTNVCTFYQLTVLRDEANLVDPDFVQSHDMGRTYKSESHHGLMVLEFRQEEVSLVLPRFENAHEAAVRRLSQYNSPRKSEHRDELREELQRIQGAGVPVPDYMANGTKTLSELQSSLFEANAPWSREMLTNFASSILKAHNTNPRSWVVRYYKGEIALHIAMSKVMAISPNVGHFMVLGDIAQIEQLDILRKHLSSARALDVEATWVGDLVEEQFTSALERAGLQHQQVLEKLAMQVKNRAQRASQHQQQIVDFISHATGISLPAPAYNQGMSSVSVATTESGLHPMNSILTHFTCQGLTYTPQQIATFYTSLQTKGFVVLSGISGTGKSKIAQHFVQMLPGQETETSGAGGSVTAPMLTFTMSTTQNWAAISANQSDLFPPIDENVRQPVIFEHNDAMSKGYVILRTLAQGKPTLYLTLGSELSSTLREVGTDKRYFASFELDDAARSVERIRIYDRPVILDEIDEPGKSEETRVTNSLFLSVRPDWRDSTSLLGYYNPLTETYEWTGFLRFLLRAAESYRQKDGLAWFVILDEMNLAHVEYYFADLLSIIESGRDRDGWSQEPIRLTYPDAKTDNPPPHEIHLPPNLYIIGTVNMDETTHAFSPKVLDRAFTIELTEVDFSDYPPTPAAAGTELTDEERRSLLQAFTRDGAFARIDKNEIRKAVDDHPEIRDWLQALNAELSKHQFQFGYRVFDEIAQFVHNAEINGMFADDSMDTTEPWLRALDHAVYMKVLPKFNGSHARLQGPLTALLQWAKGSAAGAIQENDPDLGADGIPVPPATPRLPRVHDRARRMLDLLEANGFVSFG